MHSLFIKSGFKFKNEKNHQVHNFPDEDYRQNYLKSYFTRNRMRMFWSRMNQIVLRFVGLEHTCIKNLLTAKFFCGDFSISVFIENFKYLSYFSYHFRLQFDLHFQILRVQIREGYVQLDFKTFLYDVLDSVRMINLLIINVWPSRAWIEKCKLS